jgi:predicted transcriptional regulator
VILSAVISRAILPPESVRRIGRLLRSEGCDLAQATPQQLAAGCSVFLEADVPLERARALMGEHGIAQAPVIEGDDLIGFAVLDELERLPLTGRRIAARR